MDIQSPLAVAALIHDLEWHAGSRPREIADGVRICSLHGSRVETLYNRLCQEQNVDDGEPLGYELYVELTGPDVGQSPLAPTSPIARSLNLLCVSTGAPLYLCRLVWSRNEFADAGDTNELFSYRPLVDHWELYLQEQNRTHYSPEIDSRVCREMALAWRFGMSHPMGGGRVSRALSFFQHAWLSQDLDSMCVNLAAVLQCVCAPHSQVATPHQLASNCAHLIGGDSSQERAIYGLIRTFDGLHAAIVRSGNPDWDKVRATTPAVLEIVANLLRRVLLQPALVETLEDESKRRAFFAQFMFPDE
jgi:hypothetical protein